MKKFFTLIAVAAMALTANAQGTLVFSDETTLSDNATAIPAITQINGITVTINTSEKSATDDTGSAQKAAKIKKGTTGEAIFYGTTQYPIRYELQGANAKDADNKNFSVSGKVPTTGGFVKLVPTISGKVHFGVIVNASKKFCVVEDDGTNVVGLNNLAVTKTVYDELSDDNPYSTESAGTVSTGDTFSAKLYGVVTIPVKANAAYYVFAEGSNIGFAGLILEGTTAVEAVAEAKAEKAAPVKVIGKNGIQIGNYNVAGQQVK